MLSSLFLFPRFFLVITFLTFHLASVLPFPSFSGGTQWLMPDCSIRNWATKRGWRERQSEVATFPASSSCLFSSFCRLIFVLVLLPFYLFLHAPLPLPIYLSLHKNGTGINFHKLLHCYFSDLLIWIHSVFDSWCLNSFCNLWLQLFLCIYFFLWLVFIIFFNLCYLLRLPGGKSEGCFVHLKAF